MWWFIAFVNSYVFLNFSKQKEYTASDLINFKNGMLLTSDFNHDGEINKSELKLILMSFAAKNDNNDD